MSTSAVPLAYYTIVTGVAECVRGQLVEAYGPLPEGFRFCPIIPGEMAWDDCECGSFTQAAGAWLWSDNGVEPLAQLSDHINNCGPNYLGLVVDALLLRCAAQPADGQLAPSCDALQADALIWFQDSPVLRRGVLCCLQTLLDAGTIEDFQITAHTAVGPNGACVGQQLTYRFWLPNCEC